MVAADSNDDPTHSFVVLAQGTMVSHYRIINKISSGGMGEVYLAEDTELNRKVALKFLHYNLCHDEECRIRFKREAQAAARLKHPNIITVFEVGDFKDRPFFAMEHVEGMSLKECIDLDIRDVERAVELMLQVLEGIRSAHEAGVIHRDIKPSNILLDSHGRAQVVDFGLAYVQGTDHLSKTGSTVGTVGYMSPEQVKGEVVDSRTDLFSSGIVLYQMLAGHNPFRRDSKTAILRAITDEEPEPISRYKSGVPDPLQQILSKLLQKDRELRYQSAADVIADLTRLQSQRKGISHVVNRTTIQPWHVTVFSILTLVLAIILATALLNPPDSQEKEMNLRRITSDGRASAAAISPDGNLVAYARNENGQQALWINQIVTKSQIQLVPPSNALILTVRFSRDGNFVYYTQEVAGGTETLHRVPSLGGQSELVLSSTNSAIDWSPDGSRICFLSFDAGTGTSALTLADRDGEDRVELVRKQADTRLISDPSWHPREDLIACVLASSRPSYHYSVAVFSAVNGEEIWRSPTSRGSIRSPIWLPDGSAILYTNTVEPVIRGYQIVKVGYRSGDVEQVTRDLSRYSSLSVTSDGGKLLAIREDLESSIHVSEVSDLSKMTRVSLNRGDGLHGICWTPDDQLIFTTEENSAIGLWSMGSDGSDRRPIVTGEYSAYDPDCSMEGSALVYVSDESGTPSIWSCQVDGSRNRQLTFEGEDHKPRITSDNKWIVFETWRNGPLQVAAVPLVGGQPKTLVDHNSHNVTVSSTDESFACWYRDSSGDSYKIGVFGIDDGRLIESFEPSNQVVTFRGMGLEWSPNNDALYYLGYSAGSTDLWVQPINGDKAVSAAELDLPSTIEFKWSMDGRRLALVSVARTRDVVLLTEF